MKYCVKIISLLMVFTAFTSAANQLTKEQSEVWEVVIASYADIEKQDSNWTNKWATEDLLAWGNATPMPRNRASIQRWEKFQFSNGGKNVVSDYTPTGIVVHGDTAVAHYYFSNGTISKDGKADTSHGRCSDVLVRDGKSWKFVAWHCADEPES
ncbi:nuclear transport factor 2 family protein [Thalassotalea fonticola]|uniref:Nuclear transport factor 2 family protein n=1 Tax=Thalassotalea fonticola TaxID=3065649 RepID=A0ABZ0GQY7_9GAMM|nr:nuclear transport factor 2 family protein [Colwelliaceae bacterium S1-1]